MATNNNNNTIDNNSTRKTFKESKKSNSLISDSAHSRKQERMKRNETKNKNRKPRRRIFPIWFRIIVISLLAILALLIGMMIGYGILGDGSPADALKFETWKHILDIVNKVE